MRDSKLLYKDYLFVGIQLLLFISYFFSVRIIEINLPEWLPYLGLVVMGLGLVLGIVALLQLNTNISPFPTPVEHGKLLTTGAFSIARHPIYTALIMSGFGFAIYHESIFKVLVMTLLIVLFYFKSKYEEGLLMEKFPAYKDYKKRTRRFI